MKRVNLIVGLGVILVVLYLVLGDPQTGILEPEKGEFFTPQLVDSASGRWLYLIDPGRAYRIPVRCTIAKEESLEAIRGGRIDLSHLAYELSENGWAAKGTRSRLLGAEVKLVRHEVWQVHGGDVIRVHGRTDVTTGVLTRSEVVDRYNRGYGGRRPRGRAALTLADVYRTSVSRHELHADIVLYVPEGLPPTGTVSRLSGPEDEVYAASYGQKVVHTSPVLPGDDLSLFYSTSRDGKYVVRASQGGGEC